MNRMRPQRQLLPVFLSVVSALAANIVLEVFTDLSVLSRGLIAVPFGLLVSFVDMRLLVRRGKQENAAASDRT